MRGTSFSKVKMRRKFCSKVVRMSGCGKRRARVGFSEVPLKSRTGSFKKRSSWIKALSCSTKMFVKTVSVSIHRAPTSSSMLSVKTMVLGPVFRRVVTTSLIGSPIAIVSRVFEVKGSPSLMCVPETVNVGGWVE